MFSASAADFTLRHGLRAAPDPDRHIVAFLTEMERGLEGEGSLRMIPTFIVPDGAPVEDIPVAVLDAGGTNLRSGIVHFSGGEAVTDDLRVRRIPGADGEISSDEFFAQLARFAAPDAVRCGRLCFCFSYAAQPVEGGDSRVVEVGKQLNVSGIVGRLLGESLKKELSKLGAGNIEIKVLNDSAAVLLAGLASSQAARSGGCVGFILGTGTNSSYCEKRGEIKKLGGSDAESEAGRRRMIVNVESGSFKFFPRGDIDRAFDASFADEGKCVFEKTISGRYFSPLVLFTLRQAAREGVFSDHFAQSVGSLKAIHPAHPDAFLAGQGGALDALCADAGTVSGDCDRAALTEILEAMFDRGAQYCAINLIALIQRSGLGRDPLNPVCISADGSAYTLSAAYRRHFFEWMEKLASERGIYYTFYQHENETFIGTAALGLSRLQ